MKNWAAIFPHEKEFKAMFLTVFLATYCANEYPDACARGEHERLSRPPVEDAMSLADDAWEKVQEVANADT